MKQPDSPDRSDRSDHPRVILPHGGYRKLRSFQAAQAVYDSTVLFCGRFVDKRSRTHDQMIQAARSGVQNIAEGSMASATSRKAELKLTGVARASLEELLLDYEDFLRQRGLRLWAKDSPEALVVRGQYRSDQSDPSDTSDKSGATYPSPPLTAGTKCTSLSSANGCCIRNSLSSPSTTRATSGLRSSPRQRRLQTPGWSASRFSRARRTVVPDTWTTLEPPVRSRKGGGIQIDGTPTLSPPFP